MAQFGAAVVECALCFIMLHHSAPLPAPPSPLPACPPPPPTSPALHTYLFVIGWRPQQSRQTASPKPRQQPAGRRPAQAPDSRPPQASGSQLPQAPRLHPTAQAPSSLLARPSSVSDQQQLRELLQLLHQWQLMPPATQQWRQHLQQQPGLHRHQLLQDHPHMLGPLQGAPPGPGAR